MVDSVSAVIPPVIQPAVRPQRAEQEQNQERVEQRKRQERVGQRRAEEELRQEATRRRLDFAQSAVRNNGEERQIVQQNAEVVRIERALQRPEVLEARLDQAARERQEVNRLEAKAVVGQSIEDQRALLVLQDQARAAQTVPPQLTPSGRRSVLRQESVRQALRADQNAHSDTLFQTGQQRQQNAIVRETLDARDFEQEFSIRLDRSVVDNREGSQTLVDDFLSELAGEDTRREVREDGRTREESARGLLDEQLAQSRDGRREVLQAQRQQSLEQSNPLPQAAGAGAGGALNQREADAAVAGGIQQQRHSDRVDNEQQFLDRLDQISRDLEAQTGDPVAVVGSGGQESLSLGALRSEILALRQPDPSSDDRLSALARRVLSDQDRESLARPEGQPNAIVVADQTLRDERQGGEFRVEARIEREQGLRSAITNTLDPVQRERNTLGRLLSSQG